MSTFESTNHEFFYRDRMVNGRIEYGASCACNNWHVPFQRKEQMEGLYVKYVEHVQATFKALEVR